MCVSIMCCQRGRRFFVIDHPKSRMVNGFSPLLFWHITDKSMGIYRLRQTIADFGCIFIDFPRNKSRRVSIRLRLRETDIAPCGSTKSEKEKKPMIERAYLPMIRCIT